MLLWQQKASLRAFGVQPKGLQFGPRVNCSLSAQSPHALFALLMDTAVRDNLQSGTAGKSERGKDADSGFSGSALHVGQMTTVSHHHHAGRREGVSYIF